ncbi:unnamed protein product [Aphanomyces euteiches]
MQLSLKPRGVPNAAPLTQPPPRHTEDLSDNHFEEGGEQGNQPRSEGSEDSGGGGDREGGGNGEDGGEGNQPDWSHEGFDSYNDIHFTRGHESRRYPMQTHFTLEQKTILDDMGIKFVKVDLPVVHCEVIIKPHSQAAAVGMVSGMRISGMRTNPKGRFAEFELDERPLLKDHNSNYPRLVFFQVTLAFLKERNAFDSLLAYQTRAGRVHKAIPSGEKEKQSLKTIWRCC